MSIRAGKLRLSEAGLATPTRAVRRSDALADRWNSVLVCAAQLREQGQDEELSRRGRGDPRSIPQAQDRLHHVLAGLGVVAALGSAGAPEARQQGRADLR